MSHNLHFLVIKADTAEDACTKALSQIEDWGNEANWRTVIGSVSEYNELYLYDHKDYSDVPSMNTIEKINKKVKDFLKCNPVEVFNNLTTTLLSYINGGTPSMAEWYLVKTNIDFMYQKLPHINRKGESKFNVLEDEFFSWELDKFGVTQLESEGSTRYVVLLDMHS